MLAMSGYILAWLQNSDDRGMESPVLVDWFRLNVSTRLDSDPNALERKCCPQTRTCHLFWLTVLSRSVVLKPDSLIQLQITVLILQQHIVPIFASADRYAYTASVLVGLKQTLDGGFIYYGFGAGCLNREHLAGPEPRQECQANCQTSCMIK